MYATVEFSRKAAMQVRHVLKALIFDVDGTLAETEELHRESFNSVFTQFGLDWHWSREIYGQLLTTTGGKERIARYVKEQGLPPFDSTTIANMHSVKNARYAKSCLLYTSPSPRDS